MKEGIIVNPFLVLMITGFYRAYDQLTEEHNFGGAYEFLVSSPKYSDSIRTSHWRISVRI